MIGVQHSLEQRLRAFDPDLEKNIKDEINFLFDFFDSNKNGEISHDELAAAIKASNPSTTPAQIELMMKQSASGTGITRKEFIDILLPFMKEEMLSYQVNFEELRRTFRQFDAD